MTNMFDFAITNVCGVCQCEYWDGTSIFQTEVEDESFWWL